MKKSAKIALFCAMAVVAIGLVIAVIFLGTEAEPVTVDDEEISELTGQEMIDAIDNSSAMKDNKALIEAVEAAIEQGTAGEILLADGASVAKTPGVSIDGDEITIIAPGVYILSGTLTDGRIKVESDGNVALVLAGVSITNTQEEAINIKDADCMLLYLAEGTDNVITSGVEGTESDGKGAAIYSKDNLAIAGPGALDVYGHINNGIATTDKLYIFSGSIQVHAVKYGIKGKDSMVIIGGSIDVFSGADSE